MNIIKFMLLSQIIIFIIASIANYPLYGIQGIGYVSILMLPIILLLLAFDITIYLVELKKRRN